MAKKKTQTERIDLMELFQSRRLGGPIRCNEMESFMKRLIEKGNSTQIMQFKNEILARHYPEYVSVFENLCRASRPELMNRETRYYNMPSTSAMPGGRTVYRNIRAAEFSLKDGVLRYKNYSLRLAEDTQYFKPALLARVHHRFNIVCKDDKFHFLPASDLQFLCSSLKSTVEIKELPKKKIDRLHINYGKSGAPTFFGTTVSRSHSSQANTQSNYSDGVDYSLRKYKGASYTEGSKTLSVVGRPKPKKGIFVRTKR